MGVGERECWEATTTTPAAAAAAAAGDGRIPTSCCTAAYNGSHSQTERRKRRKRERWKEERGERERAENVTVVAQRRKPVYHRKRSHLSMRRRRRLRNAPILALSLQMTRRFSASLLYGLFREWTSQKRERERERRMSDRDDSVNCESQVCECATGNATSVKECGR